MAAMEDRIVINVSGRRYETHVSTLRRLPHSLLGDEQRRAAFWDAARDEFFFDRSASSFEGVLLAFQTGGEAWRPCGVSMNVFLDDLRFYGLSDQAERLSGGGRAAPPPPPPPPPTTRRGKMAAMLQKPAVAAASLFVTLVAVLAFVVMSLPILLDIERDNAPYVWVLACVELVCMLLVFVELVMRLVASNNRVRFFLDPMNIVDLLATVPFFVFTIIAVITPVFNVNHVNWLVNLTRLVRLFRVFRFVRQTAAGVTLKRTAAAAAPSIGIIFVIWVATVLFFASLVFWVEMSSNYGYQHITSIPEAIYWAVITMTTVGYGDKIPMTIGGRVITGICAYMGYVMVGLPIAVIVTKFFQCSGEGRLDRELEESKNRRSSPDDMDMDQLMHMEEPAQT